MTLKTILPSTVFTDPNLPKLYRDFAITPGTKYCFDALDVASWPKQAAPTIGSDVWKTLVDANSDTAAFLNASGAIGFNGGFDFSATTGFPNITMPTSSKPAATDSFLNLAWIKYAVGASGYVPLYGLTTGNVAQAVYLLDVDTVNLLARLFVNGVQVAGVPVVVNGVYQFGLAAKRQANGTYVYYAFCNGALVAQVSTATTALIQPTPTAASFIANNGQNKGKVYRTLHDNLSTSDPLSIVAADYAANAGRFS